MRSFKNVHKSKQLELDSLFPDMLKLYSDEETGAYKKASICVFDHWLSQEEAINEIDNVSYEKEQEHNKRLQSFCTDLAKAKECYLVKLLGKKKERTAFKEFISEAGLEKTLTPENHLVSDMFRFVLAFPELNTIYFEGCDFTHHVYFKNESNIQFMKFLATTHGLYLLK